jgi:hypothetical protein
VQTKILSGILPDQIAQFGPGACDLLHVNWLWIKYGKHYDPTRRTAMVSESLKPQNGLSLLGGVESRHRLVRHRV